MVGAIGTRLELPSTSPDQQPGSRKLYIMTLGVLADYRGHGIGELSAA